MQDFFRYLSGAHFLKKDCCIIVYDSRDREPIKTLDRWKNLFLKESHMEDPENFPFFVI